MHDTMGAHSSAWLERYLDMVEVIGSSPIEPTITSEKSHKRKQKEKEHFFLLFFLHNT